MAMNFKKALAIVPARGGSKRVVGKNLRMLHDKPLVVHTLDTVVASGCFDKVVLSSDDDQILALGEALEGVSPVRREPEFSGDHATIFSFLHHFTQHSEFAGHYDAIALLLPTAPFRSVETVQKVAEGLDRDVDSVITVSPYDFPVQFAVNVSEENQLIEPLFNPSPLVSGNTRSQNQAPVYHPNGAVFFAWWDSYAETGSFYKGKTRAVVMDKKESVDIDTEDDFVYAEYLMRTR